MAVSEDEEEEGEGGEAKPENEVSPVRNRLILLILRIFTPKRFYFDQYL